MSVHVLKKAFEERPVCWKFYGAIKTNKVHTDDCQWTKGLDDDEILVFDKLEDAIDKGFDLCLQCLEPSPELYEAGAYIGNKRTKEVHKSSCFCVKKMAKGNKAPFFHLEGAITEGYDGCQHCLPRYSLERFGAPFPSWK
jgi:hypothetical protein